MFLAQLPRMYCMSVCIVLYYTDFLFYHCISRMPHDYLECLTSRPDSAEVKTDFYMDKMDEFITQFTTAQLVHNNILDIQWNL